MHKWRTISLPEAGLFRFRLRRDIRSPLPLIFLHLHHIRGTFPERLQDKASLHIRLEGGGKNDVGASCVLRQLDIHAKLPIVGIGRRAADSVSGKAAIPVDPETDGDLRRRQIHHGSLLAPR